MSFDKKKQEIMRRADAKNHERWASLGLCCFCIGYMALTMHAHPFDEHCSTSGKIMIVKNQLTWTWHCFVCWSFDAFLLFVPINCLHLPMPDDHPPFHRQLFLVFSCLSFFTFCLASHFPCFSLGFVCVCILCETSRKTLLCDNFDSPKKLHKN